MKTALSAVIAGLVALTSQAGISDVTANPTSALSPAVYIWSSTSTSFAIEGNQVEAGAVEGTILNDIGDPTLTIYNSVKNQTAYSWSSYNVAISMSLPFSISNVELLSPPSPTDWSWTITQPGLTPVDGAYTGNITLLGGTPVPIGGKLFFGFDVTYDATSDSVGYCINLTPVPEPATGSLLLGMAALGFFAARKRRA